MIIVDINRDQYSNIKNITVSGHSGYDELGKDIVCSAVSTAMYVSIGLLERFDIDYQFSSDEKQPIMKLNIIKPQDNGNIVLENLVETLNGIAMDYSKYLKISEK